MTGFVYNDLQRSDIFDVKRKKLIPGPAICHMPADDRGQNMTTDLGNIVRAVVGVLAAAAVLTCGTALARTTDEIYGWVEVQLKLEAKYPVPVINFVSRQELREAYRDYNAKAFKSWSGDYGDDVAIRMMDFYLDNVVGLFIPENGRILVGNFMAPCRQEAVAAHEMVHYIQEMKSGRIAPNDYNAVDRQMFREMQGSKIEAAYIEAFCPVP